MCGIIAYVGTKNAVPFIIEGLKKLEYRGYDSAGIAVIDEGSFAVAKQKGRLEGLEKLLETQPLSGSLGIGHTRWATHGEPLDINSHPHIGSKSRIAVVHNGIIENYQHLKERLEERGVVFHSQTDSEVVAQLAEFLHTDDIVDTIIRVTNALEGSYALGIMSLDEPDKIFAIKKDSPLIIGTSPNANFIASDIPAVLEHTNQVYHLEEHELAILEHDKVTFINIDDRGTVEKTPETITWTAQSAEKGGYEHFMLKEIFEQPQAARDTIQSLQGSGKNKQILDEIDIRTFNKLVVIGCGSAYNAGMVGKYVIERLARIGVEVELASEFRYKDPLVDDKSLVLLISQSGETADTVAALREAKRRGATTISIVNVVGSTIAKESDYTLYTLAGPEISVATTKAFSTQLIVLYYVAVHFAAKRGTISVERAETLLAEVATLPEKITEVLKSHTFIKKYAASSVGAKNIFFIGRNIDYAIALEGSLKLKEISYIHSEAYAGGELKHGTISLIEDDTLVVALSCSKALYPKIYSNAEQVITRGAKVLFIGNACEAKPDEKLARFDLPPIDELFSSSLSVIALQLFSYYVAANKGLDIDKPRNLAKSVTVE